MNTSKSKISYEDFLSSLKILAAADFKSILNDLENKQLQDEIIEGQIVVDNILKVIGVFIPPVAVVANDLGVAISIEQAVILLFNLIHQTYPKTLKASLEHKNATEV